MLNSRVIRDKPLLFTLCLLVGLVRCTIPASAEAGHFKRFSETISPDGKYVLAWGEKSQEGKLSQWTEAGKEGVKFDVENPIENYLVNLQTGRIVSVIPELDYFSGEEGGKNHADLHVAWAPDSSGVLVIYDGRYDNDSVSWVRTPGGAVTKLRRGIDTILRRLARAKYGKQEESKRGGVVIRGVAFVEPNVVSLDAVLSGFLSKFEQVDDLPFRLKLKLHAKEAQAVELLASRALPQGESDGGSESLEDSLNTGYRKYRATLSPAAKEVLKQQQLQWLKQREAVQEYHRDDFTRQRIGEFEARMEKW